MLEGVHGGVMEGRRLSDAMALQGSAFPPLYRAMVSAGETSGALSPILERLADGLERSRRGPEINRHIRQWAITRKVDDIVLDPKFMKALGYEFAPRSLSEMIDAMDYAREHPDIQVVVLTGAGPDAFCSGGDQNARCAKTALQTVLFVKAFLHRMQHTFVGKTFDS